MSEKILELNTAYSEAQTKVNALEGRLEEAAGDKDNLLSIQDELRAELQDKMALLDEFEDKFNRQYRCGTARRYRRYGSPRPHAVVGMWRGWVRVWQVLWPRAYGTSTGVCMRVWHTHRHMQAHTMPACALTTCAPSWRGPGSWPAGRSWEDEKASLMAQIEALKRDLKAGGGRGKGGDWDSGNAGGGGASSSDADKLRRELNDAREKEVGVCGRMCTRVRTGGGGVEGEGLGLQGGWWWEGGARGSVRATPSRLHGVLSCTWDLAPL